MRQFKLSNDNAFADKLRKIVGLYVDPPDHAVMLSLDEKARPWPSTQPGLLRTFGPEIAEHRDAS